MLSSFEPPLPSQYPADSFTSYDGDDTTAPAPAPATALSQVPSQPASALKESAAKNEAPAFGEEPDTPYTGLPFESGAGNQHSQSGNGHNANHTDNHEQSHNSEDANMDHDHFGPGIKEDG
jgi:hypothetical protein